MPANKVLYLIAITVSLFISCQEDVDTKSETTQEYTGPIMEIENLTVTLSDSGRTTIKLTTPKQLKLKNEDEIYPKTVYVTFYDKNGVQYSTLRGDSARFYKETNQYVITGNVFFFNRLAQQSMSSELINWNPLTRKISTDKRITINTPTEKITGIGMTADQDFTNYTLNRVSGIFQVDSLVTQPTPPTALN